MRGSHSYALAAIAALFTGSLLSSAVMAAPQSAPRGIDEATLIATLNNAEATWHDKQLACRELRVVGTDKAVPALAALLTDEKLSHMARFAMESMPYGAVDAALRDALGKTTGDLRIGVIASIGVRRDDGATEPLITLLKEGNPATRSAAAAALGRIASSDALQALQAFAAEAKGPDAAVAADALHRAAEQYLAAGRSADAATLYVQLRDPRWPATTRLGALIGLLEADPAKAAPRIEQIIRDGEPQEKALAMARIEVIDDPAAVKPFAGMLPKLPAADQAVLIQALAAHGKAMSDPILQTGRASKDSAVRLAALEALKTIGNAGAAQWFVEVARSDAPKAERDAAWDAMAKLDAPGVSAVLVAAMQDAPTSERNDWIRLLMRRNQRDTFDAVAAQTESDEPAVARTAFAALGAMGEPRDAEDLIARLARTTDSTVRYAAQGALFKVVYQGEPQQQAQWLRDALKTHTRPVDRVSLIKVFGGLDNPATRAIIAEYKDDENPDVREAAREKLGG